MNSAADAGTDAMTTVCDQGAGDRPVPRSWAARRTGRQLDRPERLQRMAPVEPSTDIAGIYYTRRARHRAPVMQSTVTVGVNSAADAGHRCDDHGVRPWRGDRPVPGAGRHAGRRRQLDRPERQRATNTFDPSSDPAGIYTYTWRVRGAVPG
ncbi:MAG: hypothetical protein H6597_00860 [Flavobacteriales bacterium]|nr:hypothetical protein [Flavobacteriales bacterium]